MTTPSRRGQIPLTPQPSDSQPAPGSERSHDSLPTPAHIEGFVQAVGAVSFRYKLPGEQDDYRAASTRPLSPGEQEHELQVRTSAQAVASAPGQGSVIYTRWSRVDGALALAVVLPSTRLDGFGRPVVASVTLFMRPGSDQDIATANDELRERPDRMFGLLARTLDEHAFTTKTRGDYAGPVETVDPAPALGIRESYSPQLTYGLEPLR